MWQLGGDHYIFVGGGGLEDPVTGDKKLFTSIPSGAEIFF